MESIILVGAGGHCKVIIDIIKSTNAYKIIGITDKLSTNNFVDGIPILGDDTILQSIYEKGIKNAFICVGALGNLKIRNEIYNKLKKIGFNIPILIHKNSVISPYSKIGKGTCIMPGVIINSGATIGENCIINTGAIIEHDCSIDNNVHISPRVVLGGGVVTKSNTHVGIGSTIIQGINIGENVTIGAGSVVINNIVNNEVVVGVPAKSIREE